MTHFILLSFIVFIFFRIFLYKILRYNIYIDHQFVDKCKLVANILSHYIPLFLGNHDETINLLKRCSFTHIIKL